MGVEPEPETDTETESELLTAIELFAGVTVTVGVVFDDPLPLPPQPIPARPMAARNKNALRVFLQRREWTGTKKKSSAAIAVTAAPLYQLEPVDRAARTLALDGAVVLTVTVPVPLVAELIVTVLPVRLIPSLEGPLAVRVTVPV